jgi:heme A synthase
MTHHTSLSDERLTPSLKRNTALGYFSWSVLLYTLAVIVWGTYVRATGSGAGCGNHWPLCNGTVIPRTPLLETVIEFSHRVTSGLSVILISILAVWVFKTHSKSHLARKAAGFSVFFIFLEALIGAGLVLYGLVTHDQSSARVFSLGLHLNNTFFLGASLALTAIWTQMSYPRLKIPKSKEGYWVWAALIGCLAVGTTGAITALGDTLWPSHGEALQGLVRGLKNDMSPNSPALLRLRVIHPFIAIGFGIWLMTQMFSRLSGPVPHIQPTHRLGLGVIAIVLTQLAVGLTNLALLAPISLQMIHLFLANGLWIALVLFVADYHSVE